MAALFNPLALAAMCQQLVGPCIAESAQHTKPQMDPFMLLHGFVIKVVAELWIPGLFYDFYFWRQDFLESPIPIRSTLTKFSELGYLKRNQPIRKA